MAASIKAGLLDDVDLSSLKEVIIAGSVCPPEVAADLERRMPNGRSGQLFGMTETILIMPSKRLFPGKTAVRLAYKLSEY